MDEHELPDRQEHYEAEMEGEAPLETMPEPENTPPVAAVPPLAAGHRHTGPAAPTKWQQLQAFFRECVRVFRITKKPDKQEFMTIVKISGAGILIIGAIGFLVHLMDVLLFK